jgi:hypothetical protein
MRYRSSEPWFLVPRSEAHKHSRYLSTKMEEGGSADADAEAFRPSEAPA